MRKFPYNEPLETNERYLKDRNELFNENGNGWWCLPSKKYIRKKKYNNRKSAKKRQGFSKHLYPTDFPNAGFINRESDDEQ